METGPRPYFDGKRKEKPTPLLMQLQAVFDCGGNASWGTTRRRDLGGSSLESPHCCRKKTMLRLHIIVCGLIFSGLVFEITEYARYADQGF